MGSPDSATVVARSGVDVAHSGEKVPLVCLLVKNPDDEESKKVMVHRYTYGAKAHAITNMTAPDDESEKSKKVTTLVVEVDADVSTA